MQALADISRSGLCCHSNETRAPIAIEHNQGAPPTVPPNYIWVRAVVWACGDGHTHTQTRVTNIHFASSTTRAKCNVDDELDYYDTVVAVPRILISFVNSLRQIRRYGM